MSVIVMAGLVKFVTVDQVDGSDRSTGVVMGE